MKKLLLIATIIATTANAGNIDTNKKGIGLSLGFMGAGISYFDKSRDSEIFGSFMYYEDNVYGVDYERDTTESELHISLHYRKFFKPQIGGYYYGGFARYTKLDGKLKKENSRATQGKVGIGAEVGYTSFGLLNFPSLYWNSGLGVGTYLSGDSNIYARDDMMGDMSMVFHIDLIRIGYLF